MGSKRNYKGFALIFGSMFIRDHKAAVNAFLDGVENIIPELNEETESAPIAEYPNPLNERPKPKVNPDNIIDIDYEEIK